MFLNKLKPVLTRIQLKQSSRLLVSTNNPRERKRFYKDVTFTESFVDSVSNTPVKYEINLDKRKLKTPNGRLFQVNNEFLAALIANEWKSQDKFIRMGTMHLTSLLNTCIDNPMGITKEKIIDSLKVYIKTDTILYREFENKDLLKLQDNLWTPYVDWINKKFPELNLKVKYDISTENEEAAQSPNTLDNTISDTLERYLNSFNLNSLIAFNYICENLKSVILSLALVNQQIDTVEYACDLALLETQFQQRRWGKVDWFHSFEEAEIKTRIGAALVFFYFNSNSYNVKTTKSQN